MQARLPGQRHTPKGTRAWCVYCGRIMELAWDDYLGTARCGSCGISVYDFYVRTANGLWRDGAMSRFQHTVQKEEKRWPMDKGNSTCSRKLSA